MLDAYAATVRAETLEDVRGIVEGHLVDVPPRHSGTFAESAARSKNLTLHGILYALTQLEAK